MIPIFLTGLGCKNRCTFCNQSIATNSDFLEIKNIEKRVEESFFQVCLKDGEEIAFYGSNFTAINISEQLKVLSLIKEKFKGFDYSVRISTRPDFINKSELKLLYDMNVRTIELGVQSMDEGVLKSSNRYYTKEIVNKACSDIKEFNIKLSLHQMIGLPLSNIDKEIKTTKEIIDLRPNYVRIHPTLVLKDTALYEMYKRNEYKPLNLDEAVFQTEKVFSLYMNAGIKVIRTSLHPTDLLLESIIAGPWDPRFQELVYGLYLKNIIKNKLKEIAKGIKGKDKYPKKLNLIINPKDESALKGKKGSNYKSLIEELGFDEIDLILKTSQERGKISIS